MSSVGWRVVRFDFEKRWTEAHRAPKVHVHERTRILAGDFRAIERDLEPTFTEGQQIVLSWSQQTRHAVYDDFGHLTGEVLIAPRIPLFTITVRKVKRHRLGGFRVYFDVVDRREVKRLIRRKPPALREGDYSEANEEQVAEAAIESAYTSNPKQALDHLEAVDDFTQKRISREARAREVQSTADVIAAAEDVMAAIRERAEQSPEFKREARLTLHRMRREIDRFITRQKRKVA